MTSFVLHRYLQGELNQLSSPAFVDAWLSSNGRHANGNTFSTLDENLTKRVSEFIIRHLIYYNLYRLIMYLYSNLVPSVLTQPTSLGQQG